MQIIKTIFPNKCYPLHLNRDEKGNVSCSVKTFNESMSLYFNNLSFASFANWESALESAYDTIYKYIDLPKPEVKDLVPQLVKMSNKIFLERNKSGSYDISILNKDSNDSFTHLATVKDLNSAIKKAEKIISLLEDISEVEISADQA